VYIVPIQENIMPPLVYVVRRGVNEAMEAKADLLILDMKTDGGRVDVTEEIIRIISQFPGLTVTYVNDRAFSAGAFISVATQRIYMAPQSVIGAAAPIMMTPGGVGADKLPDTMEVKMTSAIRALVRVQAEKNGHNVEVIEAMIDKTKELTMDGEVLNKEGNILTLTDRQAAKEYGHPPRPLLSSGTVESLEALLAKLGYANAPRVEIKPTGAEKLGTWINAIGPLLLIIGMIGLYIEFKTPGFGLPGIVGITAFALYFLGGYVAGLSGAGWAVVFVVGLILVGLELFVFPGTFIAGISGAVLMLVAIVMAMVDRYPGAPALPTLPQLRIPLRDMSLAIAVSFVFARILVRFFPKTSLFRKLVSQTVSGVSSGAAQEEQQEARIGQSGVAISQLYPGGKARFGEQTLDVLTEGESVEKGQRVKIIGHTGSDAVVKEVD
jgi:membrane-bound serine protease (ClpP class)